jgi:hypothetical protein
MLQLNFNHYQPSTSNGWNSLSGDPRTDFNYSGFKWNDGSSSNVNLKLADSWGGANEFGMVTGDNSGVYPDDVMKTSFWVSDNNGHVVTISGLDASKSYDFTFFGSRNGSGDRTTDYTIGSQTTSLNASYNSNNTVSISSVKPDQYGTVKITVKKQNGASYGYLNALVIEELSSTNNSTMTETRNQVFGESFTASNMSIEVSAFPNPFVDQVTVELSQAVGTVTAVVSDLSGRQLVSRSFEGTSVRLDLSSGAFASGTYILTVSDQNGLQETLRLIKQ